jgi:HipA-like protein
MPIEKIMEDAKSWLGLSQGIHTPTEARASFQLKYGGLLIGVLSVENGVWKFAYSEDFKRSDQFRPLVEFPDVNQVYVNKDLWQFFAARIPSTEQDEVLEILQRENISETDSVGLLKRFGKQTIANPFSLELA